MTFEKNSTASTKLELLFHADETFSISNEGLRTGNKHAIYEKGVYKFRKDDGYAKNFAKQWKQFQTEQYDHINGTSLSRDRIADATKWNLEDMRGDLILEAGCGAGRFTRILAESGANVVSFDYSSAVEVSQHMNGSFGNVSFFQADILNMPFKDNLFDRVFCYGVLQHTPDPYKSLDALIKKLKPGGWISTDIYPRDFKLRPSKSKYFWRWLTTRMDQEKLMALLEWYIPRWFPYDTRIKKHPILRKYLGSIIPCWNYSHTNLPREDLIRWAVMDTFDALAPKYDKPAMKSQFFRWFKKLGLEEIEVRRGSNGIIGNGKKPRAFDQVGPKSTNSP